MHITRHAAERYVERIAPSLTVEQATAHLEAYADVIDRAAAFGCRVVRLGSGVKLILEGDTVVTVYDRDYKRGWLYLIGGHVGR